MSNSLDIIVKKMNNFGKKISEKSNLYFKQAVNKSEEYADKGIQQIEIEKLKWKLKKIYIELGEYIHASNTSKNISDYSDDENFILLLEKISRIKNMIKQKMK